MMAYKTEVLSPDLDAIGDWSAPEGSEPWAKALRIGMQRCVDMVELEPRSLLGLVRKALRYEAWTKLLGPEKKPFKTFEEFCSARQPYGLGRPYELIRPYLVAVNGGNEVIVAALTTRAEAAPTHADAGKLGGRPRKDSSDQKASSHTNGLSRVRGETSDYLAARIARDAPAVHEAMKAGKYPSVRAAGIAAGIVKPADPVKAAARAIAKVPRERVIELAPAVQRAGIGTPADPIRAKDLAASADPEGDVTDVLWKRLRALPTAVLAELHRRLGRLLEAKEASR